MSLDHLLAALEHDATAQAERLVVEARATAERLTSAAAEASERRRRETFGAHEREQRAVIQAALSAARRAARRDVLEARERLLDRVFAAARAALPQALAHQAYRAALPERLAAALACVEGAGETALRVPAALATDVRAAVSRNGRVTVRVDQAAGSGFRLATADGSLEVDDTLETRLDAQRPRLARDVLRQLEVES
jgi:vacuolar-type H+-ATPase subunit E/Vma4